MKTGLYIFVFLIGVCSSLCWSQNQNNRVEISGYLKTKTGNNADIAIYNKNNRKGTFSDENGKFKIKVREGDVVIFSAIFIQKVEVTINENHVENKFLSIWIKDHKNKLSDVVIFNNGLTGNLNYDVSQIDVFDAYYMDLDFALENMHLYYFEKDAYSNVENPFMKTNKLAKINILGFAQLLGKLIFPKKRKTKSKEPRKTNWEIAEILESILSKEYIKENFNIEEDKWGKFIDYLSEGEIEMTWLEYSNRIFLLDYVEKKSILFRKQ